MRSTIGSALLMAAMAGLLGCTTSSSESATAMDPACEKACDEAYQAKFEQCKSNFDNTQCEEEAIAALRSCTGKCR